MKKKLNDGWRFAKGEPSGFSPVTLPHDWLISDPSNLYESGVGWYERDLDAGFLREGQRLSLRFDGVYMDSALFANGELAGEWKYGYTAFEFDITDFLRRDRPNVLRVRVNYQAPNSRWYTGAGIYRDVFLIVREPCHFKPDGVYVTTAKRGGSWSYEVDAEVETGGRPYELRHALLGADEGIVEWDIEAPRLYTLRSELIVDGAAADVAETRIGFRAVEMSPEEGFRLNGRRLKLNGVCLHHDLGSLGAAVHPDAIRRQLSLLKAMGVNALRTAHNPPAESFMDLADEMGFLVVSEILDVWRQPKNEYDYARFFDEWIERDVASWIRRDRNHPSVILWSIGNEIADTHKDPEGGARTLRLMADLVRRHDPNGRAPVTLCSNYMPWENTQKCADLLKVVGYNYGEALYEKHHAEHPDWVIYGSETCATVQSRGVYHFPLSKSILADDDLQCSALGNSSTSWGAKSAEACALGDRALPFSLGQFVWVGQDHLGEPTPYHTKSSYLGHIDTAGFPKDSYYVFQAAWTDFRRSPMVHLFPYWDFSPGQLVDLRAATNAPRVELFLDGESLGARDMGGRLVADWRVPYRPGVLRAVAYDGEGKIAAESVRRSFGDAARLRVDSESFGELVFAAITAEDADGNPVENAVSRVRVSVEGGELLALDNGDSTDYESYRSSSRRMFGGKLLAIVRADASVRAEGREPPRVSASLDEADVPIRKIELLMSGDAIAAKVLPPNASYRDLSWRLTDAAGIDSPLGGLEVAPDGMGAVLKPKGDGEVYIRCSARSGRAHPTLISQLEREIAGLGKPFLDPYSFVSGGLCGYSNVELTNGNERGVATLRDRESHVGFRDLDFGPYGSDELTLSLFPLSPDPFSFEIWEGMPLEGGSRLRDVRWEKGSIWNTYQEIACELPRRLRGVTSLCLVFRQKVHVKGFRFAKRRKAFMRLAAAECDQAYGDSFTKAAEAVEGIGNNVTLAFEDMDFGEEGASRAALSWRSLIPKNSIQLVFSGEGGRIQRNIDVDRSDDYASASFDLGGRIRGRWTVSLVFLPGCSLDLAWIQFLE